MNYGAEITLTFQSPLLNLEAEIRIKKSKSASIFRIYIFRQEISSLTDDIVSINN
jgi:hypothetical protein